MSDNKSGVICRKWFNKDLVFDVDGETTITISAAPSAGEVLSGKEVADLLKSTPPATAPKNGGRL